MPALKLPRRTLELTDQQRAELEHIRDHDARAYLREKAAALLKIADGHSPHWVAAQGLLKPRHKETVYGWLNHYQKTKQLPVRKACRGTFSPSRRPPSGDA